MKDRQQGASNNGSGKPAPKHEIPATRLFKVLNPELFMKPNRFIMYGGVVAMAGIVYWLGSNELQHRQQQDIVETVGSQPERRTQTYQERMADIKRSSAQ
ncbi:Small integral membrane protein 8 [Coemansia sp. RSA 485]|nr:Small integral membrane protein 8 [Coemansia sp. RSA 485]